jgi:hypothetical protein
MFKKYSFFILSITLLTLLGCRKKVTGFEMSYRRQFKLPIGLDVFSSHNFRFFDIASDTSIFFKVNGSYTADQISLIEPKAMNLRAVFGEGDFIFIDKVEVWISDSTRPKLTPKIIFFRDDVPLSTGTRLDLVPNNVDVRPFLLEGSRFTLRINLRLRAITERSIETEWNTSFFAKTSF